MIGRTLSHVTQHWVRRRKRNPGMVPLVHFEPAYQMTGGVTCCGIDLHESKVVYDETRAKVNCRPCLAALKANENLVKRNRRAIRDQTARKGRLFID